MATQTPSILPHEQPLPPRWDLWTAAAFLVLGLAIVSLAWAMPTYREQKGEIYTAPGLVPGIYGLVIAGLSIWLAVRSVRRGALSAVGVTSEAGPDGTSNLRLAFASALALLFCVGLIGRMPFWAAAATFVTAFIAVFEWRQGVPWALRLKLLGTALLQGIVTGVAVMLVFEKIFYVRLP
jgi:putative tricarboxylic transport membrane protein